jgi:hypothetical protein
MQQTWRTRSTLSSDMQVARGLNPWPCLFMTVLTTVVLNAPASPSNELEQSVLPLNLSDILGFLQQFREICPGLQMTCPLSGVPLPSIDINFTSSPEYYAKITLSHRLSHGLLQYVMDRT